MRWTTALVLAFACLFAFPAEAKKHHRHHHRHYHRHAPVQIYDHPAPRGPGIIHSGLVTVQTAAGIPITVNPSFARRIVPFIADLVAMGYHPRHIGCFAHGGHVRHSRHYAGAACDLDQRGWGRTAGPMYHVSGLAARHGLRDGCVFHDCGHIDDGASTLRSYAHVHHRSRYGG